jgi:hypothetical protein
MQQKILEYKIQLAVSLRVDMKECCEESVMAYTDPV